MRVSTRFIVDGIAPDDITWHIAPEGVRREFWREVVRLVKDQREYDQARGLDRYGHKLTPISQYTRAHRRSEMGTADPNAPPLTPADALSRTVSYFDGRAYPTHAEFFWRNGWGRILHFHRIGAGRLPVRDVIGISVKALKRVQGKALAWWETWKRTNRVGMPEPMVYQPPVAARPIKPFVPRKIAVAGRMPTSGARTMIGASQAQVERAAKAGYFTGFRQVKGGLEGYGPPRPPTPAVRAPRTGPRTGPAVKRPAARRP